MDIQTQLFEGQLICLAPIDHEKDPEIESKWTHDPEYLRMLSAKPARPLSPAQIKKKYEAIEKEMDESRNTFYFTIRMRGDDRLVGFIKLFWVEWTNGNGWVELGIGDANDRGHGYGSEALRLILRYAFAELNLYRLSVVVSAYNLPALHLFTKAGFVDEERRREILKKFDAFIEAIVERRTIAENELADVSGIQLAPEASTMLDLLMSFVPPPLAPFARNKIIAGAAQLAAAQAGDSSKTNGAIGLGPVVQAFWMGTPEPARDQVRGGLQQLGLWHFVGATC